MEPSTAIMAVATMGSVILGPVLPNLADVRKSNQEDDYVRKDVRTGEIVAIGIILGVGLIATNLSKNAAPLTISVLLAGLVLYLYEGAYKE